MGALPANCRQVLFVCEPHMSPTWFRIYPKKPSVLFSPIICIRTTAQFNKIKLYSDQETLEFVFGTMNFRRDIFEFVLAVVETTVNKPFILVIYIIIWRTIFILFYFCFKAYLLVMFYILCLIIISPRSQEPTCLQEAFNIRSFSVWSG